MGMDLDPIRPHKGFTEREVGLSYSWTSWRYIIEFAKNNNIDTSEFSDYNDGDKISAGTCKKIAQAIFANTDFLIANNAEWLLKDANAWKHCGGFRQN